ncbi:zinc finger CCCH domain-containing protein 41-like isoform X2 [Salvia hispanica]|uniref:zinc finger CCCH domain-containing protein 41-like isoform X2 n=1 Tax=Salvia hispanica TaxID=49212 RepID=UPI0020092582|nr:zinc finger CCCH domain-containing protein 41-like isoform X2 [Salvia hispanica]
MELKVSPEKPGFSSSDVASDTEEKEISEGEDEDDDRNHKHRRREARSQSQEGDSLDNRLTRPYRKRNRPFENGYSYRDGEPQSGEHWRNHNMASDRDFPARFDKRRFNQGSFSKAPSDLNQRIRGSQILPGEVGFVRGRGREPVPWGIHDSRFGLVDVASQIVQPGPVPSAMFAGRGLSNVSSAHGASWNAFGMVPGLPNGGLESLHPLALQGPLRPAISPAVNVGLPRQRCRDFEERGFCLRGDMCPMEHGVNRIVVEDVQSLSQFNLPVSLPGSQLLGASSAQVALPVNNKVFHPKSSKTGMIVDGYSLNGGVEGGSMAGASASDVYDPDQPLWANDNPETSAALIALNQANVDETESSVDRDFPNRHNVESVEGFNDDRSLRNANAGGSHSSSAWGRISSSKRGSEQENRNGKILYTDRSNVPNQGKRNNVDGDGSPFKQSFAKKQSDFVRDIRTPAQRGLRTLYVNYIPLKDNKREILLSHFQKFGEVVDIYIPMQTEQAFVQFSKREEAEEALKAPDAVIGNRFIKLWWANRNNIPDEGISGNTAAQIAPRGISLHPVSNQFILDKGKENPHPATGKDSNSNASVSQQLVPDHPKSAITNGSKATPLQPKKLESLEILKEELRKKQEMLDQKRNEFKRQLDKLQKQAVGSKDMPASDSPTKRIKGETPPNQAKAESSKSSPRDSMSIENTQSVQHSVTHTSTSTMPIYEPSKPSFRSQAPIGAPFVANRFKLDNRPTVFKVVPPLPSDLANVAALEGHFSSYGDLASVVLEESELQETNDASVSSSNISARISFTTRRSAEKAFSNGKLWQGHKLQFLWLSSVNTGNLPAVSKASVNTGKEVDSSGSVPAASSASVNTGKEVDSSGNLPAASNAPSESADIQKTPASGSDELGNHRVEADADSSEQEKDSKSTATSSSGENQL